MDPRDEYERMTNRQLLNLLVGEIVGGSPVWYGTDQVPLIKDVVLRRMNGAKRRKLTTQSPDDPGASERGGSE